MLTGHRGSGKSTELSRLRLALENPDAGEARFFVVPIQADDELDRNDIDFPEVLIAIVRQLAEQLRKRADIELKPGYFKDRWERLKQLLFSEVSFDKLELGTVFAKLSAARKTLAGDVVRLEGCPVSVAEQVLALVNLGGLKNPYTNRENMLSFGRAYLGWKTRVALNRLQRKRYL